MPGTNLSPEDTTIKSSGNLFYERGEHTVPQTKQEEELIQLWPGKSSQEPSKLTYKNAIQGNKAPKKGRMLTFIIL